MASLKSRSFIPLEIGVVGEEVSLGVLTGVGMGEIAGVGEMIGVGRGEGTGSLDFS